MPVPHDIRWHCEPAEAGMQRDVLWQGMERLMAGVSDGRHPGAQMYVSRHGQPVVEFACGESRPGWGMGVDHLMAWFSASKPVTAVAIALLYDQGRIDLEDPVIRYLPDFGNGKESCTIRHVLTHQGGFAEAVQQADDKPWPEIIREISAHPAEYPPGERAGYHPTSGWYVLGEIVRVVDGRPIEQFVGDEIFTPLGMADSHMGITPLLQSELESRLAHVALGHTERTPFADQAFVDRFNSAEEMVRVNPSGGIRGPARDLGRFYEMLLAGGQLEEGLRAERRLLDRRTVELFTACHRWNMPDSTLMGAPLAWGLGFGLHGNTDIHRAASRRVFGHSGMVSSVGLADPVNGLICVVITSGLLDPMTNARRLRDATGAAFEACTA